MDRAYDLRRASFVAERCDSSDARPRPLQHKHAAGIVLWWERGENAVKGTRKPNRKSLNGELKRPQTGPKLGTSSTLKGERFGLNSAASSTTSDPFEEKQSTSQANQEDDLHVINVQDKSTVDDERAAWDTFFDENTMNC